MGKKKFDTFTRLLIVIVSLAGFTIYAGVMFIMNQIWNPEALSIADKELILHRITINNCIEQVLRGMNHAAFLLMIIYACVSKIIHLNKELKFFAAEITWVLSITFLFVHLNPAFGGNYKFAAFRTMILICSQFLLAFIGYWAQKLAAKIDNIT